MKFPTGHYRKLIDFLLLNAYSCGSPGLANGKAGMSLALFEIAGKLNDEALEEHAFELLQEALIYSGKNISFGNGNAGIGFSLLYLVRNKLIEADYMELFGDHQQTILKTILSGDYKCHQIMETAEMLMFMHFSAEFISPKDFQKAETILLTEIKAYYGDIQKKGIPEINLNDFYHCSALLLNVYKEIPDKENWGKKITAICRQREEKNIITESVDLGFGLMEYGKNRQDSSIVSMGEYLTTMAFRNVVPLMLSLREKTNLFYYLSQCDVIQKTDEGEKLKKQIIEEWTAPDIDLFEQNIVKSIRHKAFYCGMGQGVARFLLMTRYWEQLMKREKVPQIEFLFY